MRVVIWALLRVFEFLYFLFYSPFSLSLVPSRVRRFLPVIVRRIFAVSLIIPWAATAASSTAPAPASRRIEAAAATSHASATE